LEKTESSVTKVVEYLENVNDKKKNYIWRYAPPLSIIYKALLRFSESGDV
jgi:hypothetical protein